MSPFKNVNDGYKLQRDSEKKEVIAYAVKATKVGKEVKREIK